MNKRQGKKQLKNDWAVARAYLKRDEGHAIQPYSQNLHKIFTKSKLHYSTISTTYVE